MLLDATVTCLGLSCFLTHFDQTQFLKRQHPVINGYVKKALALTTTHSLIHHYFSLVEIKPKQSLPRTLNAGVYLMRMVDISTKLVESSCGIKYIYFATVDPLSHIIILFVVFVLPLPI